MTNALRMSASIHVGLNCRRRRKGGRTIIIIKTNKKAIKNNKENERIIQKIIHEKIEKERRGENSSLEELTKTKNQIDINKKRREEILGKKKG